MDEDKMGIVIRIAIVLTARDIAKRTFNNHILTSTLVTAEELMQLEARAVMSGLMALATKDDAQDYHLDQYSQQIKFIEAVTEIR